MKFDFKKIFQYKKTVLGLVVILLGGGYFMITRTSGEEIQYKTMVASRGSIRSVIQATGLLDAVETIDVGTQISGTVTKIYINYNSRVKQGQLIAEIDSSTQETEVAQAEANLLAAQADLMNYTALLAKARKDLSRTIKLADKDLIAKAEVDSGESSYLTAAAQVASAEARVKQSEAALTRAKINLGYTKIYSPVDGVVVAKTVEQGQTVAASYATPSIAKIAKDLKQMRVEVNVDEADIAGIKQGQKAEFTVDAYKDKKFFGEVTQIRLSPKTNNNVVTYAVIVGVSNDDGILLPGMSANVSLIVQQKNDILMVPNSAFRFKPVDLSADVVDENSFFQPTVAAVAIPALYTLETKAIVKKEVEKGITDGQNTEILSGLNEGETVITGIIVGKKGK